MVISVTIIYFSREGFNFFIKQMSSGLKFASEVATARGVVEVGATKNIFLFSGGTLRNRVRARPPDRLL